MSTDTTHPAVADLAEPLLDVPDRRVCEVRRLDGLRCRNAADWAVAGNCTHCGTGVALVCEQCRPALLDTWQTLLHFGGRVTPTWIEPIR